MNIEKKRLLYNAFYPSFVVFIVLGVKVLETLMNIDLSSYGLQPRVVRGLQGIAWSPLLHGDWNHLYSNIIPLWFLTYGLFYYYRDKAFFIFGILYLTSGLLTWVFAQGDATHIGASGLVYALVAFHFVAGVLKMELSYLAYSLVVVFLYGSLVWGVFPELFPEKNISWEGHLMGFVSGVFAAIYFRKFGPQKKVYEWDEEDEDADEHEASCDANCDTTTSEKTKIDYHYSPDKTTNESQNMD